MFLLQLDNDVRFDVSFRDILGRHHPKLYFTYTYLSPTTLFFSIDNENQLCVVCIDSPRSHILVPCGHVCLCAACAEREVWDECPVCRTSTSMVLRAFFV